MRRDSGYLAAVIREPARQPLINTVHDDNA